MEENYKKREIPFSPPDITELEIAEVCDALRSGWITTGPRTKLLERRLAAYIETGKTDIDCSTDDAIEKYSNRVVCLNSATSAEELNLRILGIRPGDEVILPAYTYSASAAAAIHVGAKIVFIDSKEGSVEMDYDKMETAINEKTKAIIAVDLGGIICDYDRIFEVVEKKKELFVPSTDIQKAIGRVAVVADCAHALGAQWHGKNAGAIADFTSFSFHAVKNFTTAEGGASTWRKMSGIENEDIYHRYQLYSLHGQSKDAFAKTQLGAWEYDIVGPWYKCNMTDIMAAIGLKQLDRYEGMLKRRKDIITQYDKMCDEIGVEYLKHSGEDYQSANHLYITRIPGIDDQIRRKIIIELAELGVSTNVHYKPLPMMTAYKSMGWDIKDFPNAYNYYENLVTLPLHTCLSDDDVEYVVENYKKVVKEYI
jgi:dTDP-4-amino-4,6-dideoxygalactose transaminase